MNSWRRWWGDWHLRRFPRLAALSVEDRWRVWARCYEEVSREPLVRIASIGVPTLAVVCALAGIALAIRVMGLPFGIVLGAIVGATLGAMVRGVIVRNHAAPHINRFADEL